MESQAVEYQPLNSEVAGWNQDHVRKLSKIHSVLLARQITQEM